MELDPNELSDHDRQMIAVAENGDPNAPDDNAAAPSTEAFHKDFATAEDMVAWYNEQMQGQDEEDLKEDEEELDADKEETDEESDDLEEYELSDAEVELREMKAYEAVGGKEKYAEMTKWAGETLTEDQIAIYDEAVNGYDNNVAQLAVQGLQAMHRLAQIEQFGQEGEMTNPASGGLNVTSGYATMSDMMAAMADPRYQTDETFVNQVMQKVALSNF